MCFGDFPLKKMKKAAHPLAYTPSFGEWSMRFCVMLCVACCSSSFICDCRVLVLVLCCVDLLSIGAPVSFLPASLHILSAPLSVFVCVCVCVGPLRRPLSPLTSTPSTPSLSHPFLDTRTPHPLSSTSVLPQPLLLL